MRRQPRQFPSLPSIYHKYVWRALGLLALIGIAVLIDACGSIEKDYKYFHWFVDGIPEPGSQEASDGQTNISSFLANSTQQLPPGTKYYSHKPWADEDCHSCHQGVSQFSMPTRDDSQICLPCHQNVVDKYRYMHGAVVSVACLWCHAPHLSQFEHLLRAQPPGICLQCHTIEDGSLLAEKEHTDLTRNCLECHFGHGSDEPGFLKPLAIPNSNENPDIENIVGPPTTSEDELQKESTDQNSDAEPLQLPDSAPDSQGGSDFQTKENN